MRIGELAARAGTTVRTVRYYVAQGLLPGPVGLGPRSAYAYEHLVRLGAIRALKERYLPLAEIGRRLEGMSLGEMEALAAGSAEDDGGSDAVGRPIAPGFGVFDVGERPAASAGGFGLPSARRELRRGVASSTPAAQICSNRWQRVVLAPGVELSFQLSGDAARDGAIAELVEQATRRLAGLGEPRPEAQGPGS